MNKELEPVLQELWDMVQEALKFRKPEAENQGEALIASNLRPRDPLRSQTRVRVDNISMVKTGN